MSEKMKKKRSGGIFTNPAKKLRGLSKLAFWIVVLCFVAYGVYSLVLGISNGDPIGEVAIEAVISIICVPIGLYIATLAGICLLDMIAAIREIADKMQSDDKQD